MSISQYVYELNAGIDRIGFLFGAGTSYEAGYPLIAGLTDEVIGALSSNDNVALAEVLEAVEHLSHSDILEPNIEKISDFVMQHYTNSGDPRFKHLAESIRAKVNDCILGVENPKLDHHIAFLEALKVRSYGRPTCVYIFTTNYDLLFELAAAEARVRLINGFVGTTSRYFSEREFHLSFGQRNGQRFIKDQTLTVRLIKLHGSISWFEHNGAVFERDPLCISAQQKRCMVLPRRSKVIETLSPPYDQLFAVSSALIGPECKQIVANGFSFNDDHINNSLLFPRIEGSAIHLTNFCEELPVSLASVKMRPNVTNVTKEMVVRGDEEIPKPNENWKFSEFAKLF